MARPSRQTKYAVDARVPPTSGPPEPSICTIGELTGHAAGDAAAAAVASTAPPAMAAIRHAVNTREDHGVFILSPAVLRSVSITDATTPDVRMHFDRFPPNSGDS